MIYELINLQYEQRGQNIKIYEKSGMRKDRYSSLAYNYWVQHQLEIQELQKPDRVFDVKQYAAQLGKLQHKPITY
jgi:hypothetical protein